MKNTKKTNGKKRRIKDKGRGKSKGQREADEAWAWLVTGRGREPNGLFVNAEDGPCRLFITIWRERDYRRLPFPPGTPFRVIGGGWVAVAASCPSR